MTTPAEVRAVLNTIVDPCSTAAGLPAGLVDMGLVSDVAVAAADGGERVSLTLGVTEPGCFMIGSFAAEARARLLALDGVAAVELSLTEGFDWTEDRMDPAYRSRLTAHRSRGPRADPSTRTLLPLQVAAHRKH